MQTFVAQSMEMMEDVVEYVFDVAQRKCFCRKEVQPEELLWNDLKPVLFGSSL